MEDGQTWKSPDIKTGDFSALTIHLSFKGTLQVSVQDHRRVKKQWAYKPRVYTLHRDTPGEEVLGIRLYKTDPSFEIKAVGDASVKVDASVYEL